MVAVAIVVIKLINNLVVMKNLIEIRIILIIIKKIIIYCKASIMIKQFLII